MSVYMSLVQSMSSVDRHCRGTGEGQQRSATGSQEPRRFGVEVTVETAVFAHREEQGGDGSAAPHVDHGEEAGEVAFSGSSEEQSTRDDVIVVV